MIVIFSKAFLIFSFVATHPEVYDRIRTKDVESLHQVISNKAEDVSCKGLASDVLKPLQPQICYSPLMPPKCRRSVEIVKKF